MIHGTGVQSKFQVVMNHLTQEVIAPASNNTADYHKAVSEVREIKNIITNSREALDEWYTMINGVKQSAKRKNKRNYSSP